MSKYRGFSPALTLLAVALVIGAAGLWWFAQKDATPEPQENSNTLVPDSETQKDSGHGSVVTESIQAPPPTTYPLFDEKDAKIGLKVGTFTLSDIVDTGHGKSYVFTGSSTISGTYRLDGIDGPYFQTDKPIIDSADELVTIPGHSFYFTNGEKAHAMLSEGEQTIVISGYTYNGAVIANDGRSDVTTLISAIK